MFRDEAKPASPITLQLAVLAQEEAMGSEGEPGVMGEVTKEEAGQSIFADGGVGEWVADFLRGAPDADREEVARLRKALLRLMA